MLRRRRLCRAGLRRILLSAAILFLLPFSLPAQQRSQYTIYRAASPIVIDAKLDEQAWRRAPSAGDFHFRRADKLRQQTVAKLVWDDENLYVSYYCLDRRITAFVNERHGPVSRDDCVEIFLSPNPSKVRNYYTFEINAIGAMLNRAKTDWWKGPPTWEPEGVRYRTSFHGLARKQASGSDREWIVELAVPFANFDRDAARTPPRDGDRWRLNLHRLEGRPSPDSQLKRTGTSTWSPLGPEVNTLHSPEWFGEVRFANRPPPTTNDEK